MLEKIATHLIYVATLPWETKVRLRFDIVVMKSLMLPFWDTMYMCVCMCACIGGWGSQWRLSCRAYAWQLQQQDISSQHSISKVCCLKAANCLY